MNDQERINEAFKLIESAMVRLSAHEDNEDLPDSVRNDLLESATDLYVAEELLAPIELVA